MWPFKNQNKIIEELEGRINHIEARCEYLLKECYQKQEQVSRQLMIQRESHDKLWRAWDILKDNTTLILENKLEQRIAYLIENVKGKSDE